MAELDIPTASEPTTIPSTTERAPGASVPTAKAGTAEEKGTTVNGHGNGFDGVNGEGKGQVVTIAVVGAGQRGQVSTIRH
jgi:hypothetical protein